MTTDATHQPLAGYRVIDFTHVLAGPACGYMLGLLGAEVIKVESPRGDAMRWRGGTDKEAASEGRSTAWQTQAAGKRSIVLDLETDFGGHAMDKLLATADVLVENHLPQTLERLGLADLDQRFPKLIHCAMTGYGRGGELENAPAYDVNIQAASGLMTMTGTADTGPLRAGAPVMDYGTALAAGFAICAALLQRERTGQGTLVDVSMYETAMVLMASAVTDMTATGRVPKPRGNAANSRSPTSGTFPCKDGLLSLGVNEPHQFNALATALDQAAWLDDPRFATDAGRSSHAAELEQALLTALQNDTAENWEIRLRKAGVAAAALRGLDAAVAVPQLEARGFFCDLPGGGRAPTLPFRIGNTAHHPQDPPRDLGADTAAILAELGLEPPGDR
ncbi:CoA transferase [Cognatiyoonia sp. IB215182]|uniref:CaiB/BaiF CoA transferase family protein n=1 Tax=Cognatiyoonia sp. IB215182 TaxID=3097353 RepID=UPI002A120483|nr:CoA transferase [Cognatiyoonia sp. IB215182]MDX8352456.1 CoA transferase [Cognatiyoonia sp. IB215182]